MRSRCWAAKMAYTLELSDGTTTYSLLDGANTFGAKWNTLNIGVPEAARATAQSILRTGFDITAHAYSKRTIQFLMSVTGTSIANLTTNVQNITDAIRKARVWAITGLGSKWRLKYNPGGTAKDVYFTIRDGVVTIPPGALNASNLAATPAIMTNVGITLTCDPLAEGDSETIENFVEDAGFEVAGTALADWTESKTATGTTAIETSIKKHGKQSLKLVMTAGSSGQVIQRSQTLVDVDAGETWSYQVWVRVDELTQCKVVLEVDYTGGTPDVEVATTAVDSTQFVKLTSAGLVAPSGTTSISLRLRLEATGASPTGTAYFDSVIAVEAATVPETWVASRAVYNNMVDDDQRGVNHIDIHDVLGDHPAKLQLKLTENENHTKLWAGARHSTRQYDAGVRHEGEDFATWTSEPSDGTASDGNYGQHRLLSIAFDAVSSGGAVAATSLTISHVVGTGPNRYLIVGVRVDDGVETTPSGVTYDSVTMTQIGSTVSNGVGSVSMWKLINPNSGTADIVITFGTPADEIDAGGISLENVHQTTSEGTLATANGHSTGPSVAVTSVLGDLVIDCVANASVAGITFTPGPGQTKRWEINGNAAMSEEVASGTSTTMSWTMTSSDTWVIAGVAVKPADSVAPGTASSPTVLTKSVTTPPQGVYRALARVRNQDGANIKVAMGHAYGGVTSDPSVAADYADIATTQTAWHILDIGSLVIPPSTLPDGASVGTLTLRLAFYIATLVSTEVLLDIDWLLLLPVDQGTAYATKAAGTDVVVIDTTTNLPSLTLWDTSDVFQSRPEQRGGMITVDPEGTRIYLVDDDGSNAGITEGWKVAVKVVPQYLNVG